jgi:SagB-type dehydrogenase family enzyme
LTLAEVGQLLWAAQGTTHSRGYRTAPSAGALYPLEIFIVTGNVTGLSAGVYRYQSKTHSISKTADGDLREALRRAALGQRCIAEAPAVMVICAVYERTTAKYRERGLRYVMMETGHAAQNVYLQAVPINVGTVVIGAFQDVKVQSLLNCSSDVKPLYLMPLGKRRR